jgi:hypothetical protein
MTKTEKKIEWVIVKELTLICDKILEVEPQFQHLNHHCNFKKLNQGFRVNLFFDHAPKGLSELESLHANWISKEVILGLNSAIKDLNLKAVELKFHYL